MLERLFSTAASIAILAGLVTLLNVSLWFATHDIQ